MLTFVFFYVLCFEFWYILSLLEILEVKYCSYSDLIVTKQHKRQSCLETQAADNFHRNWRMYWQTIKHRSEKEKNALRRHWMETRPSSKNKITNIGRGTMDPGCWVLELKFSTQSCQFQDVWAYIVSTPLWASNYQKVAQIVYFSGSLECSVLIHQSNTVGFQLCQLQKELFGAL